MDDIILIYEKPGNYFLKKMNNVYAPYDMEFHSPKYWIYRALHTIRLPLYRLFWGEWKKKIKECKKVIIFDYGYQRGMDTYIKKLNPDCEVFLFYWNTVDRYRIGYKSFKDKEHIYSFDFGDCEKYGFRYNTSFMPKEAVPRGCESKADRIFFIGTDKGNRIEKLLNIKKQMEAEKYEADFRVFSDRTDEEYRRKYSEILIEKYMAYEECLNEVAGSGIILDLVQENQAGLTLRFIESVMLSKKLITDNEAVKTVKWYNSGNIYVLKKEDYESLSKELKEFLKKPFVPYEEKLVKELTYESWVSRFEK